MYADYVFYVEAMAGRISCLSIGRVSPVMRMRILTGLPITA